MKSVKDFLEFINTNVPYYKKINSTILESYPVITKQIIKDNYDVFLSNSLGTDKGKIIEILEGNFLPKEESVNEIYEYKNFIFEETTGTSGIPFRVVKTKEERFHIGTSVWRMRRRIDPYVRPSHLYKFNHTGMHEKNMQPYKYETEHILNLYKFIEGGRYRWLHVSPNPLLEHIKILRKSGCITSFNFGDLKYIECTGNYYSSEQKKIIEDFFQVKTVNQYGSIETWPLAYTCQFNQMHILDNVIIEILDDENNPVKEYGVSGNIVITCLDLKTLPFIRYKIGDYGKFIQGGCKCGMDNPVIELLPGREVNILKGVEGKVFGNIFFAKIVQATVRKMNAWDLVNYIQVWQNDENSFTVFINNFSHVDEFIKVMETITIQEIKKKINISCVILNSDEIEKRKMEKPNIFLCKF